MRTKAVFASLFLVALAAGAQPKVDDARFETATGSLSEVVRQAGRGGQPVWVSWTVPVIEGHGYSCCFTRDWKPGPCQLETKNQSWGSSSDDPRTDPYLTVLVRLQDGKVERIRSVSASCPLNAGGRRFLWLEGVQPEESVRFLTELVKRNEVDEEGLDALALHRNAGALTALSDFATSTRYRPDLREHALFWLGEARGREGYEVVMRVLREDKDDDIREKALFALSESPVSEAGEVLVRTARADRSPGVRSQAMFWLSQIDHPQAPATILEAIAKDADPEVREQGVFALSQLPKGKGVPLLIKLGRESRDREVRKQALFWLAESEDPEAVKFLEKMLEE
ncbi:MAG: HEAT repeat domain-containing protein [Thermoanaerobaculia bacterium]